MTEAEVEETIKQAFIDGWTALHPTIPISFDGEVSDASETWVRLTILPSTRQQMTAGATARFDVRGNIMVQLFGSVDVGATQLAALADDVRTVLERKRWTDLVTYAGATRKSPTDGRWEMRVVTLAYRVEEQRS
jgi:hypothetical protein